MNSYFVVQTRTQCKDGAATRWAKASCNSQRCDHRLRAAEASCRAGPDNRKAIWPRECALPLASGMRAAPRIPRADLRCGPLIRSWNPGPPATQLARCNSAQKSEQDLSPTRQNGQRSQCSQKRCEDCYSYLQGRGDNPQAAPGRGSGRQHTGTGALSGAIFGGRNPEVGCRATRGRRGRPREAGGPLGVFL